MLAAPPDDGNHDQAFARPAFIFLRRNYIFHLDSPHRLTLVLNVASCLCTESLLDEDVLFRRILKEVTKRF